MTSRGEAERKRVSGLAVILTALICLFGFSHLNPGATFAVAAAGLMALIVFFWR